MKDHVADLYSALVNGGYNVDDLGGSMDGFREAMSDSAMRKEFYDWVGRRGNFRLPDYDVYESALASTYDGLKSEVSPEEAKENADSINQFMENRDTLYSGIQDYNTGIISGAEQRRIDSAASEMEAQAEAARQRLQEDGTIDRMKEAKKEARQNKRKGFLDMFGSAPAQTSFLTSPEDRQRLAQISEENAQKSIAEYSQNKLLQEKLDVALDMARAGENQDGLRGVENFGLGLWDSATRLSTWDFGASDIVNNLTLQQIVEKWENDPSSLTATEQKVLDGIGMATAVQEMYSDQVGIGYNVGQSLPESAGFMASMALNPASGLGKSLARNAVRTYGRNSIAKNLARIGGDIAETAIMTATTGAGRVAADALERINGSSTYEIGENGVIMYGGQKDQETVGNAVIKAIGSNFIENYSEALGEYFDPLLGMSRKVAAGGLRKMNLNKWADALSDVQPSQMTASIRSLREKTKFGGIFGEVMEEEIGMVLNAISGVGDYTFSKEKADKEGKQWIFDLENQLTTVLSCAIMSGTLNGVEQVSSVAARRRMEKNAKNAEQYASYRFHRDEFAPLREAIDQASPEGMVDVLRDVYMSQEYTVGQKRALAEYAAARLQLQYYNAADAKARRQVNKTQQELLDAQEAGLNAQLPQLFSIARAAQRAEDDLIDYDGDWNLVDIIRSSMNRPEEMERILGDLPPREAQLVTNYIYSRARMEGAYQGRSNRAEDYIDDFAYALEPAVVTDTEGNRTITTAIMGDRSVYVLDNNGDLAHIMLPDGGKTLVKASELTNITTSSAEEVIDRYRDMYTSEYNAETENAFEHHPKTQAPQVGLQLQSPEGEVVITAVNDNMVEIVPAVYKDGQVQPKEGAEPRTITVDDAYAWQDDYYLSMDADQAHANAMAEAINMSAETTENEGTPIEQIEQSVSEEVTDGQNVEIQPTEEVVESVAPTAPQTARERVPKGEDGNPIYEQTDADTAWDAIVEETEGNVEMAQSVAEQMLANKKAALDKLQKGKAKAGANVAQIIANEKKHQEAIAKAEADVKAWERIAQVNIIRQQKAELERAAAEKAEAEQRKAEEARILAEQEEQARIEREQLNGVPDMVDDTPQDARARGFRRVNGHKVDRQGAVPSLQGKEVGVKFANDMIANGRVAVIEAETLQPSHLQGQRNPAHFIDEAQPKERNDEASVASARQIASNIRPEEITTSVTAYTGAPTVNMRGEAIQGNSRSDALRVMWAEHPDQAEKYKQYLIDHAEEFGLNAEDVAAMQHPVLVNMLDVNDADAINLGQYVAQDTESGGTERIKPKNVARKMGSDIRSYANILLRSSDEEASFSELVDRNGVEVLKWMNTKGYITPTQYASAFDSKGNLTAEAKNDLRGILYQSIFQGGNTQLEEQFNAMPAKAQKAILATAYRDYDSPDSERMVGEIQSSIRAYYALSHDRAFVDAKNYTEAKEAMLVWSRQYQMDDVTGESFLPSENFSNFALELAVRYKGNTQSATQNLFNELFDLIQGTKEASLFEEADNRPRTLAEAIKETLNIDYNGQNGSNALVGDDTSSQEGRQGSAGDSASGELSQNNEPTADDRGRAAGDSDTRAEETGGVAEVENPSDGYILEEGEKDSIDKATISQLKNLQRTIKANLAIIDRIEKSGKMTEELVSRRKRDTAWLKSIEDSLSRKEQIKAKNKWGVKSGNHPVPLGTVKKMFAEWNENADIQALFDRVLGTFEKLGVNITFEDNIGSGKTQGWFAIGENRVKLPTHMIYSNRLSNQSKASVMVHEMIHGVTQYVLYAAKLSEDSRRKLGINLSEGMITAAEQLNEIYDIIKKDKRFKGQYGIEDVHEMVSELAEPEFRALLKATTIWDRIVDAIRNILGLNVENNALDGVSKALDYIIDNYDADLYRKVSAKARRKATANVFDMAEDVLAERELQDRESRVYHGSGSLFDKFNHSFMGTGEGNQAFGWGTYVSEAEGVGKTYAKIASKPMLTYKGQEMNVDGYENPWRVIKDLYDMTRGKISQMRADAEKYERLAEDDSPFKPVWGEIIGILKNARRGDIKVTPRRVLYSVEIPDNNGSNYLEWYEAVPKGLLNKAKQKLYDILIEGDYKGAERELKRELDGLFALEQTGQNLYGNISAYLGSDKEASQFLRELGIVGMKYPTNTLHGGNIDGTNNYVIFDENDLEIVDNMRFRDGDTFYSNAERAVENIKQQKATPEQWLAMIKKDGGLKAGEDKWMGLSDWLNEQKAQGVKTLTKDEVLAFIRENQIEIEEVEYGSDVYPELQKMTDELKEEFENLQVVEGHSRDNSWNLMEEEYGSRFIDAFDYPSFRLKDEEAAMDLYYDKYGIDLGFQKRHINSTRLDYTTEGLDNKREIALVVPTIEPWNQSDTIHFGDAGEGRAVAWVRFGETTDEDGNRVLVIDEVQSKRHDEGRSKGYSDLRDYDKKMAALEEEAAELLARRNKLIKVLDEKYGGFTKYLKHSFVGQRTSLVPNPSVMTAEEIKEWNETSQDSIREREDELKKLKRGIPDAPFDKNYHELVMKRMLRYAAENGFDKVAWNTGKQVAERFGVSRSVEKIQKYDENTYNVYLSNGSPYMTLEFDDDGIYRDEYDPDLDGKSMSDIFGKQLSSKLQEMKEGEMLEEEGLSIGGDDRVALYDEMIPRFMNKYTKKWGTKVGEVTLPNVEVAGRTMWSVDVTPEMRESVMQGQPMFREGMGAISDREVSYENDPIAKFQGKPRYYGKRAAAFAERERRRMENAAKEASEMLGIEVEIITDASTLQGRKAKAKGWYDIVNKKVVVVVPNHVSMGDAVRTVLHEGIAHHGLRELFGDGFDAMLNNVYNNVAPELKARIDVIAERTGVSTSVATEEYMASLAETTNFEEAQRRGWWQQIKSYFVDMLRKLAMPGIKLKEEITDNELRYLLWRSYKNLVEPNSYLKPLGYAEDVVKQKELKVGEYAEKATATPMAADTSEAEEWAAVTMQRIEELEAQAAQLENEIAEMEADRDADDASRYEMWEQQLEPLRKQMEDVYAELEGLYSLEAEDEDIEDYEAEREAEKQRQLYQKRIDNAYLKAVREGDWEEATDLFRQYVLSKAEDEGIVPMDYGVGYRGGAHSSIAKKVKEENPDAIAEAAYQMSIRIPKGSILVPMPSRTGNATYTVKLAEAIAKATDSEVRDVLKGKARMSVYEAKQKGIKMTSEDLGMYTTEELPKGKNIVIIDNVIDKGTTALAAVSAVKGASVVAYAYTLGDKQRVASLKLAEPVTYDDNMRIIPLSQRFNKETDDIRYRLVDDPAEIERLESEPTIKAYRAMQVINGELYPPMSAVVDGKLREPIALGQWEQSEERPDLADDNGRFKLDKGNKKSLKAAYNPYFHSSSTPLNDQFSEAQDRDNLVTVEVEVPVSEADGTSGYKAEKAKDAVGTHQWKAGIIQGQLTGTREVFLTRWDKPVRIVPESEVADKIVEMFDGKDIVMPSNVVTPQLRKELEARGITFVETDNQGKLVEGEHKGEHYSKVYGKKSTNKSNNKAEIIAEVERESAALGVPVRIARSVDELPDEDTRKRAEDGKLKGYFDPRTGEVVLYEPNTNDANDAKRTILHEIVGHKGLRQLIGEQQYDKAMVQLMYMLPADVRDAVLRRAERHGWNAAIAMDEYLAEQAERDVQPTWWGKVNAKIRALLRNLGFDVKLTDADVTYILWRSRKKLQGDDLNDMAVNSILKQAARKSAEADAWNEQAFKDAEMRDFERNTLPSVRHRMGADTNDYEKAVRTLGFKQVEAWQDSMRSLLVFQQAIAKASGKDISDFENAYMYENRMSSANLMEMEQYRHMVYNPLLKEIHELEQMGASRESIINYLFAKSGLERNEVFARRDAKKHAEGDATKEQQLYDKYRQKDYAGLTALTRGDAQIADLVDDHSKKKTEYERLEQNKKRGVAVSDADLKAAKKEMDDARKAMITAIEAEAQRMVDEFEAQHNTDNLWDKIRNCTHTTLNISHDAGVMSDEVYNELWNQFQYYIPLRGFAETTAEDVYLYLGGSDSPYNAPIKTAYGRTSLADDPIATIGNMAESAIVEANRNRLKQRFLYMVERHNTDLASISDVWLEHDDVNDEWHTVFAQIPDDATPSEAKRLQQEFEDRMKTLAEQSPGKYANASQQPNIPYRVVKKKDRQEHHVIVKRNGKDVVITINGNPRVAQAINGLTNPEQNQGMITRITSWINRNLSANFTMRNPAFMVSNFVRDGFYTNSMVWVKENPAYAWQYNQNWMKCTAQIASLVKRYKRYEKGDTTALDMNNDMDRMFYEFMINGGETGYTVIKSVEDYKGLISGEMKKMEAGAMGTARRVADTIGNVVDTFGRWAEDTSRFAAYMTSRQLGRTITKSIWDAKEISVNFNKKGSGNRMMGKFEKGNRLNYVLSNMSQLGRNLYVFWNAGMQGLNNFSKAAKKSPAKFTAMAGTYFTLGVIVAAAFSGDDDEDDYYNLPEYVRRNNICFKIGKGKYATLPLPIEIRAIYGLGELAYSYLSGREGLTHGEAVIKTIQQMTQVMPIDMMADGGGAMALVPSAAKPVVEVIHNVDWTGRPIYKEKTPWNQNDPTWTLAFKSTSPELVQMSRLVNEWTNKNTADGLERPYNRGWADNRYLNNPAVWEHIMEGYLGGMATMFNQTKKTLMMPFNEDLREVRNVPIASRFIKDAGKEGRSYAARNEYYDAKDKMDSWKNEMSKAKKEVLDESLTDEQRLKAAKLRSSLEQQYTEAAERWKVLDRQRKALEEAYKNDQSEENRQALDDVMMQMATLVEAYRD